MQVRILTAAVACALGFPFCAFAQQSATDLDEVVVTSTRTAVTVDASLAAVDVIDAEEISRSQARSLPELLRGRAGINLVNQGGAGKLTSVFLRGTESDHILVLIDGMRIGSATSGAAAFQDLPVDQIDRIEIVRGPRSSLYGSEAIGGVIQIFTKRGGRGFTPRFRIGAGSHALREVSAGVSIGGGRGWFGADYAFQRTDGINACNVATPSPFSGGCFIQLPQPDRDGYLNRSLSLRGGVNATDALSFEGTALRAEAYNDFDGDFVNHSETVQQTIGGKARYAPNQRTTVQLGIGRNLDASDSFLDGAFVGNFDTRRDSASLQVDFGLTEGQLLTFGLDWLRDRVESDTAYTQRQRSNRAAFAQYQGNFGAHDIQLSLRRDDNEQFGGKTTGGLAWGFAFGPGLRLTANYGTAFKAPTFNELYFPPFFGFPTSNPDLRPERSQSLEFGLARKRERSNWKFNLFETKIENLIGLDANFVPINIDRARIRGAELSMGIEWSGWELSGRISHIDPRIRTRRDANGAPNADYDNLLARRARNNARLDLDRTFDAFRLGVTVNGASHRYDDLANTRRLGGYATLDLRAEYALASDWTLQARATNLLDREYETASFYNQPGREFGLSLRYAPAD